MFSFDEELNDFIGLIVKFLIVKWFFLDIIDYFSTRKLFTDYGWAVSYSLPIYQNLLLLPSIITKTHSWMRVY